jgi:hypothetical protein
VSNRLRPVPEEALVGALFALGEGRIGDLALACRDPDVKLQAAKLLHFLGRPELRQCLSDMPLSNRLVVQSTYDLSPADFNRAEEAFAPRPWEATKTCSPEEFPHVDDSFSYALVFNGSERARALLRRIYAAGSFRGIDARTLRMCSHRASDCECQNSRLQS